MTGATHQKAKTHHQQVGFIGLGNMGALMSANLATWLRQNSCPALILWNRTSSKLPEESDSIKHAKSAQELAQKCEIIFTSMANDEAAKAVYADLFEGVKSKPKGAKTYLVETSTLFPTTAGDLERQASQLPGTFYLQAPVFGPPPMAKEAKLVWVLSGDVAARKVVQPFLVPSMGRKVLDVGSDVERASKFKLNGNFMVLGIIELLAEGLTLAEKTGVGAELLMEFVKEFMPAPSAIGYGTRITQNNFTGETGFTVDGGLKDARHLRQLAQSVDCVIPTVDAAHQHLVTSRAHGGKDRDWSSLVAGVRLASGLLPFTGQRQIPHDTGFGYKTDPEDDDVTKKPVRDGGIKTVQNF
ncbi:hypothetical protein ACM66B_001728 [Microbotryomycetes sp. NB124-2]